MQPFSVLFSNCPLEEETRQIFSSVFIRSVVIKKAERSIEIQLDQTVPEEAQKEAEDAIQRWYQMERVSLRAPIVSAAEQKVDQIQSLFAAQFPPAAGLFQKARLEETSQGMTLFLENPGAELLAPYCDAVLQTLQQEDPTCTLRLRSIQPEESKEEMLRKREAFREEQLRESAQMIKRSEAKKKQKRKVIFGKTIRKAPIPIGTLNLDMNTVTIKGKVFSVQHRELKKRGAWVISFDVTDYTGSIRVSKFSMEEEAKPLVSAIKNGQYLLLQGRLSINRFENDMILEPLHIMETEAPGREDTAEKKRVELHLHTKFSTMDGLTDVKAAISQAAAWGHKAIAITDHGIVQAFPDAAKAAKSSGIKLLYGIEAYYLNDVESIRAVHGTQDNMLSGEFVAFDLETTGLFSGQDAITEIGAVLLRNGQVVDRFQTFVNPKRPLSAEIIRLTGITNEMLKDAPELSDALEQFFSFAGNRPLIAHNASFDISFLQEACRKVGRPFSPTSIDTLPLARNLLPALNRHKLDVVARYLRLPDFAHHRAEDDAATAAMIFAALCPMLEKKGADCIQKINGVLAKHRKKRLDGHPTHMTILVQNQVGLRNLYKLVSLAHLEYFKRVPIMPRSVLDQNREGLLFGSACENSELFQAVVSRKREEELLKIASYYDFLEIMPLCNNQFMLRNGTAADEEELRSFNRTILRLGALLGKPVVATGDVHFLHPEDEIYRHILLASKKFKDADEPMPLYFKTTDEMLQEFSYLGAEAAHQVVVDAPNQIADLCEEVQPLPTGLFAPKLDGAEEELKSLVWGKARELYGEPLPKEVSERLETELHDIIGCNYAVIYMSAQKLVQKSLEDGYLVGSRGSVGSSLVAYMAGITEVNALPPHYRCPKCRHTEFSQDETYRCGADIPDRTCPNCGTPYEKDGFNIPFETFLGFGGDKVPDIDLNFSGEYQAKAHRHTFELFGEHHVFRAGTIGTIAEKTAFGYVKKYLEEQGKQTTAAEENRLAKGCVGVKRTTGQHPGGLVVIPRDHEIYDFCPVQHPADDTGTDIVTTHFEYHSMESNLLKLDLLGHDDPTMIRMLQDLTGVDPRKIPLDDKDTMRLFTSSDVLGFENDPVLGPTGACAIPEFGTRFVRGMLLDTMPTQFDTLVRISGFSHGTDVWLGNARDYILNGTATVDEVIGCRDDIMLYLIEQGMEERLAFKIMEAVRKGKPVLPEWEDAMKAVQVPQWYIDSCQKIQYLFPKAHAVAYVMMAFRIAWYKVHRPLAFYAAYFSIRAKAFDAAVMTRGMEVVKAKLDELEQKKDLSSVEEDMIVTLEVCYEFYLRGFTFHPIDLYCSDATCFKIKENGLIPPFIAISGLGETAALDIVEKRIGQEFISIEEFSSACAKVTKGHVEQMKALGVLDDLPETSQMTLF
ncbi:MAG: PolC-type DNA polymerase III [Oscillospiraceae bacterium]|nr:PolC-type DNA polymerase III [Oscillospiraceae bacterium]